MVNSGARGIVIKTSRKNRPSPRADTIGPSRLTLKVFANFSPGFALWQPWGIRMRVEVAATLKGLRRGSGNRNRTSQPLQGCTIEWGVVFVPRVSKQTLG